MSCTYEFAVAEFEEQERDAQLAAMDVSMKDNLFLIFAYRSCQPRNALSPNALSPGGVDLEANPFEAEFNADSYDEEDDIDDGLDFSTPPVDENEINNFAVLNSSLPDQLPEPHHLASYASAKRSTPVEKKEKKHRTKWHFGIRSRSPPMEVMLEIYRTLKTLGMEWKEKKNLGGLGGILPAGKREGKIERAREWDGGGHVDLKAAAGVYFVETRARVQDVVVSLFAVHLWSRVTDNIGLDRFL